MVSMEAQQSSVEAFSSSQCFSLLLEQCKKKTVLIQVLS